MGFSVKLAPGVRVRASSRGLRTSIGPREARLHVGAGRTGFSTGVGPVSYYTSIGGSSRSRSSTGASTRGLAAAAKAEQAKELGEAVLAILALHRAEFPPGQRPIAPPPPPIDHEAIADRHREAALAGIGRFARAARAEAKAAADRAAAQEINELLTVQANERAAHQQTLDAWWGLLLENDPDTVLSVIAAAFEDNEATAAPVGVEGSDLSVVVAVPPVSAMPERYPTTTQAGNLSLKKMTKRESADLYRIMVCGYALATVKEAFAVAPAIQSVRVVAVRRVPPDAYGRVGAEVVLATRFFRSALEGVQWATVDSTRILGDVGVETVAKLRGAAQEFVAVDLAGEPGLQALLDAVDLTELID